jgi:hypothetical protein
VEADAPIVYGPEARRAAARAFAPAPPPGPRHHADGSGQTERGPAAPGSTRIASSIKRPDGEVVKFDARVEVRVGGGTVTYVASVSPPSFSLALGGVADLLGDGGGRAAVQAAGAHGYAARVTAFNAMLGARESHLPAGWRRELPILGSRVLAIEPGSTQDGQISITVRPRSATLRTVERLFAVLAPDGEPVVAGLFLGLEVAWN